MDINSNLMKRWIFVLFFWVILLPVLMAQDFKKVDRYARKAPKSLRKDMKQLTIYLAGDFETDQEKVRSFYTWIIHNIKYDNSAYRNGRKRINRSNADILDRGQAVCFGYATLFKAMCDQAGIICEVIEGYVKDLQTGVADVSGLNHAWNAVLLDGKWQLMDLTWASSNISTQGDYYFNSPPETFIFSHLPGNPIWQLLDCPISPGIFKKENVYVQAYLKSSDPCFNYQDSIKAFLENIPHNRRLKNAIANYYFNPITENKEEIGHLYMDQVSLLHDRATELEAVDSIEAAMAIQLEIFKNCEKASQYIELYDHQKENLAYTHINYAVALSRQLSDASEPKSLLEEMTNHFQKAKAILHPLPQNIMTENALAQLEEYLQWISQY